MIAAIILINHNHHFAKTYSAIATSDETAPETIII
jgi:hypothetical protein